MADNGTGPPVLPPLEPDDESGHRHRQLIGILGLVLPPLLWIIAGLRPQGQTPWDPMNSVSAYYYSGSVSVFAGVLFALAVFLFSYHGYNNEHRRKDWILSNMAGIAALVVAAFPTDPAATGCVPPWWKARTGDIHYGAAVVLFLCFICFCLFLFTKSRVKAGALPGEKKARNAIYYVCAAGMMACMVWALIDHQKKLEIFWPETIALELFAFSWLVKGRADITARRALYYAGRPGQLFDVLRNAGSDRRQPPR